MAEINEAMECFRHKHPKINIEESQNGKPYFTINLSVQIVNAEVKDCIVISYDDETGYLKDTTEEIISEFKEMVSNINKFAELKSKR